MLDCHPVGPISAFLITVLMTLTRTEGNTHAIVVQLPPLKSQLAHKPVVSPSFPVFTPCLQEFSKVPNLI